MQKSLPDQIADLTGFMRRQALTLTRDPEEAKDLAADAQVKALMNLDKFEEGTNLKAWVATILRNLFSTQYQRKKKSGVVSSLSDELYDGQMMSTCHHNEAESDFGIALINHALDRLPKVNSTVMKMRSVGHQYHEIAEAVGIPIGTVKNKIHISREMMTDYMKRPSHDVLATDGEREAEPTPVSTFLPPLPANASVWDRILYFIGKKLIDGGTHHINAPEIVKECQTTVMYATYALTVLSGSGRLQRDKVQTKFFYKSNPGLYSTIGDDLKKLVSAHCRNVAKKGKEKSAIESPEKTPPVEVKREIDPITFTKIYPSPAPEPKPLPVVQSTGLNFGYRSGADEEWFTSVDEAIAAAKKAALTSPSLSYDLIQRIGRIDFEPNVVLFS